MFNWLTQNAQNIHVIHNNCFHLCIFFNFGLKSNGEEWKSWKSMFMSKIYLFLLQVSFDIKVLNKKFDIYLSCLSEEVNTKKQKLFSSKNSQKKISFHFLLVWCNSKRLFCSDVNLTNGCSCRGKESIHSKSRFLFT